jgi:FAD-dependent urate hydroxylase
VNAHPLRIAIVGCGTAGPAAAVLLKRQGHDVVLFERAEECKVVGAGFLLQPSGMVVLKELGILEDVLAHAAKVGRLHVLDSGGDTLLDLNYCEIGQGRFGAGLHRPVLLHHRQKRRGLSGKRALPSRPRHTEARRVSGYRP